MSTTILTAKDKINALFEKTNLKDNAGLRIAGKKALENLQLPDRKNEDWKYTTVPFLLKNEYKIAGPQTKRKEFSSLVISDEHNNIFILDGILQNNENENILSRDFSPVSSVSKNFFTALNAEKFSGGINLEILAGKKADKTAHIIHLSTENHFSIVRHRFHVNKNASAEIILSFHSTGESSFSNVVTEIICEENASVKLHVLQLEGKNTGQYHHVYCHQKNNSRFEVNTFITGGEWTRNDLDIVVNGENCETRLNGLYLPKEKQHVDNHTLVDHKKPNCYSDEMYKGVMSDKSTAVFNGKVFVRPDAQKINAYQQNANILLSDDATINSKPELEIYADDVKCSHGSTTGQLDEEALFYLRSRGLSEENARKLLVHAFINEVIERNSNKEISSYLLQKTGLEE